MAAALHSSKHTHQAALVEVLEGPLLGSQCQLLVLLVPAAAGKQARQELTLLGSNLRAAKAGGGVEDINSALCRHTWKATGMQQPPADDHPNPVA